MRRVCKILFLHTRASIFIVGGACIIEPRVQRVAHPTGFEKGKIMRRVCKIFLHTRLIKYV